MLTSDLCWFGCGDKRASFSFHEDLELFREGAGPDIKEAEGLFPDKRGKYSLEDVVKNGSLDTSSATRLLWSLSWKGAVSNDSVQALRKGIISKFESTSLPQKRKTGRRGFNRWKSARSSGGNWYLLKFGEGKDDPIYKEEIIKDRIRQLFSRYGILFRELLMREPQVMAWGRLFRSLRIMELSGEIISGHFFRGINGIQFISHEGFRFLVSSMPNTEIYWMNAADPASLCGIKSDPPLGYPPRRANTWLVFLGKELVLSATGDGKNLEIKVPHDHPRFTEFLFFFKVLLTREFNPKKRIKVEMINKERAFSSPYSKAFIKFGFTPEEPFLILRRDY